jgi:hypothetical protein
MQGQQRGAQERTRDKGMGEGAKKVARAGGGGGKAAGAWVIGG